MTDPLIVFDLTPFEARDAAEHEWLKRLQQHLVVSEHIIRLGDVSDAEDDSYVLARNSQGRWSAGRYIGEIAFEGQRLQIHPRFGLDVIGRWLEGALNLIAIPETAEYEDTPFIALLMAAVWSRAVDAACRHGPPAFRRDQSSEGLYVRGRLDVRRTAQLRGRGSQHVASVMRQRDLANPVSRTLVAAERVLTTAIGNNRWRSERIKEVMPQLYAAVGARPRLPSAPELSAVRYTPITRPFKDVAALSWRIARQEGFGAAAEPGRAEGLLLDVAELWELFVLQCVRDASSGLRVVHGTAPGESTFLLTNDRGLTLGRLKPDILVYDGSRCVAVADAKYKHLADRWPDRPYGVEREDLYQLASYLSRFDAGGSARGMLLYPLDQDQPTLSTAEEGGPWQAESGTEVTFVRIALEQESAVDQLRHLLEGSRGDGTHSAGSD